jgi:histidyl-tRNA synthetase
VTDPTAAAPTGGFRTLKGMHDVLPPESARRRALVSRFAGMAVAAGYGELVVPLLEDLGVFLRVGESTDVVTKEMYDFVDKDGSRIALRPEITAGVVRSFVQHRPVLPWKVWYAGTNFRHERAQKGRYRMFDQVGVEVLGVDDPDLDVEVIALAARFFASLGLAQVELLVNSLGDHGDRARYTEAVRLHLESHRGELSEAAQATLDRNPLRVLDTKRPEDAQVVAAAPRIAEFLSDASAAHFERVRAGLDAVGVAHTEAPLLVRGLDYYRRTTFEFAATALDAAQNAVGGGGRYDGLAEDLGGPPTDGIGFALGVDRILLACDAEGVFGAPEPLLDTFVVDVVDGAAARDVTHELRAAGISSDRRFGGGSMKSQMKGAGRSGARWAVIVGEDEAAAAQVTLRPLRGEGEQRRVARDELVTELRRLLADTTATDTTAIGTTVTGTNDNEPTGTTTT